MEHIEHRTLFVTPTVTVVEYVTRERTDENAKGIGFRFPRPDHSAEVWLPNTEPQEQFDPHFAVHVALARPRGFADDWVSWIDQWEIDALVDYLHREIRYTVLPQFNPFLKQT